MRKLSLLASLGLITGFSGIIGCGSHVICNVAPSISGQPSDQLVVAGQSALFTVAASGSAPLSFQWMENGVAIPGATLSSFLTPSASTGDSGSTFSVQVTNKFGVSTSGPATLSVNTSDESNIFFVAPNGNDANPGTMDQPFLTIQHCASNAPSGSTCEIRAGTYRETVAPNSGVTISAFNHEAVVVDGSDPIGGWSLFQGSIYKTNVTLKTDDTNQIFVGSDMMTEARWPNGDDLFHVIWATAQTGTDRGHVVDSSLPSIDWTGAKIHLWSGNDPFGHETGTVTASTKGHVTIEVEIGTCTAICPQPGGLYYLFGALGALDVEREWFYDSSTNLLYFMAPGKVDPNTIDVRYKNRQYGFDLRGRSNVTVRNIKVFACTIMMDRTSANNTLDGIDAEYVSHFTSLPFAPDDSGDGNFSTLQVHEADSGIVINGSGNRLVNSRVSFSAGAGVALEGSNDLVANDLIQNVDYIGDYDSGIDLDGSGNTIQHSTIHDVGRQAILLNGPLNQDISYNNLYNAMLLSRDGGQIYACCSQTASGTRIHHNWIHDTAADVDFYTSSLAMSGIVIDNNSSGFEIDQNVLWNNSRSNLLINALGSAQTNDNFVHNNSVPDSSEKGHIWITSGAPCATRIVDNRVLTGVGHVPAVSPCTVLNNNSSAAGAAEMQPNTQVGCNFDGCSSSPPPAIMDNGSFYACPYLGAIGSGSTAQACIRPLVINGIRHSSL